MIDYKKNADTAKGVRWMGLMKNFMNTKLRSKVMMTYVFIALLPFVFFSLYLGSRFIKEIKNNAMEHTEQLVDQVGYTLDIYVESISKMMQLSCMNFDDLLESYVEEGEDGQTELIIEMENKLKDMLDTNKEIAGALIATKLDTYVSTGMSRVSKDPFTDEHWYQEALLHQGESRLISSGLGRNITTNTEYSADEVFCMVRAIKSGETGEVLGVLLLDIRHDMIKNSIDSVKIGRAGFVFIMDEKDNVVYAPTEPIIYRVNPKWLKGGQQDSFSVSIHNGVYQIAYKSSDFTGWRTIGIFPFQETMSSVASVSITLAIVIVLTTILIIIVSYFLTSAITDQILELRLLMNRAESGDLSVRFYPRYGDEVGELGEQFNQMLKRIQSLIDMVYREQKSKRNAELKSLQEQIKPHFLYNTLDTIGWMAREYNAMDIVHLLDALTNMFRVGLSQGKDFITVKEEIKHVSNYLYIQKVRYKDKMNYEIEVEASMEEFIVPKLILQPLVENAIYHGIKMKKGGGSIRITGRMKKECQIFSVTDNGSGMKPERLAELKTGLEDGVRNSNKNSFGLYYIAERIQLSYGKEYGLSLESEEGLYTRVTIRLPANTTGR